MNIDEIENSLGQIPALKRNIPDGHSLKGVSTYYNADGEIIGQWVKSQTDKLSQEELTRKVAKALSEKIPKSIPITPPKHTQYDLANLYVITDYHMGMMAWHEESGDNWDVKIAEDLLIKWFGSAIKLSPDSSIGIFAQLGDFLHWDGLDAVTPTSRHILDADTRFQNIVRIAIRVIRRIIQMLLKKHDHVHIIMAEGNHDPASSIWFREMFTAMYEHEPRISVDQSADIYYCYEFGKTSLFFHHFHKRNTSNIDSTFASKYREVFGRTKHSYAHGGHWHHKQVRETNLMVVEQHRTLASSDAYSSRLGHSSGRDAQVITYHKEYGEVSRVTLSPDMVK